MDAPNTDSYSPPRDPFSNWRTWVVVIALILATAALFTLLGVLGQFSRLARIFRRQFKDYLPPEPSGPDADINAWFAIGERRAKYPLHRYFGERCAPASFDGLKWAWRGKERRYVLECDVVVMKAAGERERRAIVKAEMKERARRQREAKLGEAGVGTLTLTRWTSKEKRMKTAAVSGGLGGGATVMAPGTARAAPRKEAFVDRYDPGAYAQV